MNSRLDALPEQVVSVILDNIRIEGAQPVTLNSIRSMMTDMLIAQDGPIAHLSRGMTAIANRLDSMDVRQVQPVNEGQIQPPPIMITGRVHFWPGDERMHHVPHGFKWPNGKNTGICGFSGKL